MSTVRDTISEIRSAFKMIGEDSLISDRFIAHEVKKAALMLVTREVNKRKLWNSPNLFTHIPCIQLEQVPLAECCEYRSDCMIAKSKYRLPKIAEGIYGSLIQGVFSLDKRMTFLECTPKRYANILRLGLRQNENYFWLFDGHLYVTDPNKEKVTALCYPEEDVPTHFYACVSDTTCPRNPLDESLRAPGYMESQITDLVFNTLLKTYKQSTPDNNSDGKDDTH